MKEDSTDIDLEPIHSWFGLSYASYLTIPRTVLQSMPQEWQARFVQCLDEMNDTIEWMPKGKAYSVNLRDNNNGRYGKDKLADYERGRKRLPLKEKE